VRWWLVVLALASSCAKCGSKSNAVDASVDAGRRARRSVDVRTVLITAYPEYRDTAVLETTARVTRVIPGLTDALRDQALGQLKFVVAEDGGWRLSSFHLSQPAADTLSVAVTYDVDQLSHLYITANGLTSDELAMYLPRALPIGAERFTFDVHYTSSPERSRQLVQQAVTLALGNGQWTADAPLPDWGDAGPAPDDETVVITGVDTAKLTFHRTGGQVRVHYEVETVLAK